MGVNGSKRMDWIDGVKGVGIVYTIYAHLLPMCALKEYIYGFNIQMFFVVYGFCAVRRQDTKELKKVIIRRMYGIGLPYILWALIYDAHSVKNILKVLYGTNSSIVSAGSSGVLWFLPAFLVAVIMFETVLYLCEDNQIKVAISGVISLLLAYLCFEFDIKNLPWGIDLSFLAMTFMVIGHFIRKYFYKADVQFGILRKFTNVVLCIVGLSLGLLVLGLDTNKGCTQMANADYGNIFAFFMAGCGVSLAMMYIIYRFYQIKGFEKVKTVITNVGIQSLMIMIFHRDFVVYYNSVLDKVGIVNNELISFVASITVAGVSYLMSIIISKYLPVLVGKK